MSIPLSGLAGVSGKLHFERSGLDSEVREVIIHPDSLSERVLLGKIANNPAGLQAQTPKAFALRQNYPNPFNPATTIVI